MRYRRAHGGSGRGFWHRPDAGRGYPTVTVTVSARLKLTAKSSTAPEASSTSASATASVGGPPMVAWSPPPSIRPSGVQTPGVPAQSVVARSVSVTSPKPEGVTRSPQPVSLPRWRRHARATVAPVTSKSPLCTVRYPALRVEIALGGAIVERERRGVSGPRREGVAQDGDDAGLGQAGKTRVRGCRQRGEKEGRHQGGGEKRARHRQLCETEWRSGPAGRN